MAVVNLHVELLQRQLLLMSGNLHIVLYMAGRAWSHTMEKRRLPDGTNGKLRIYLLGVWSETYRSATWGPFVLIQLDNDAISCDGRDEERVGDEWLGSASHLLSTNGIDTSLTHVCRRDYTINCNWKVQFFQDTRLLFTTQVFCDNYLDGGYHVPYAHQGLAFGLDLSSYKTFVCISYYDEFFFPSATLAIM